MQVVPDDVLAGLRSVWSASDLAELVPGELWHGRAETSATLPYGVAKITEGDREEFSGETYLQSFEVEIGVWTNDVTPITAEIRRSMATLFDRQTLTIPNADYVTHVKPLAGKLELDKMQRESTDVLVASGRWQILIQATRQTETL